MYVRLFYGCKRKDKGGGGQLKLKVENKNNISVVCKVEDHPIK